MIPLSDGERLYNSLAVQKFGCGKIIDEAEFMSKGRLLSVVNEMLENSDYCSNATMLGAEIIKLGGAKSIVEYFYDIVKGRS